ncbi:M20 metallopeptidase family protein [Desulfopila aestuarii]|uniref:Hippurate hydrolase n=1 Tax=Desulfopila aestuarii DSM 18488 TaxID=1121416 RepID=A0A1M7Y2Y5_9BACT|nr:M20 family metallopeptidase [Desulfopila aestuarii]SHO46389.1 hippurate hydrolase [Desulfopila aestuarii DSM 18488]
MKSIEQLIEDITHEIIDLRRELHSYPEPAFEEVETAAKVVAKLERIPGIAIREGVAGTGVVATIGTEKDGPCVALRADMDCLKMEEKNSFEYASKKPGLMHACGHDGHTAALVGAALVLGKIEEELAGPVTFIFQPAEENHGGAKVMLEEEVLESPVVNAIFGLHGTTALPLGTIGIRSGAIMAASRYFTITIHGRGCHAASPHRGIDPVLIGSQIVCAVQSIVARNVSPVEPALISIPKFTGSTAPNVIPEVVTLEGTLRALSNETRTLLETRLRELVENTAAAHGGSAEISYYGGYPLLENSVDEVAFVRGVAAQFMDSEQIDGSYPPSMGAEDFAFYLQQVPGAFFWLGMQPDGGALPSLHHPRFDFNDAVIPTAIRLHCEIARNYAIR